MLTEFDDDEDSDNSQDIRRAAKSKEKNIGTRISTLMELLAENTYWCVEFASASELFIRGDSAAYMKRMLRKRSANDIEMSEIDDQWPAGSIMRDGTRHTEKPGAVEFTIADRRSRTVTDMRKLLKIFIEYGGGEDHDERKLIDRILHANPPKKGTSKSFRKLLLDLLAAGEIDGVPEMVSDHITTGKKGFHADHYKQHFPPETMKLKEAEATRRQATNRFIQEIGKSPNEIVKPTELQQLIEGACDINMTPMMYYYYLDSLRSSALDHTIQSIVAPLEQGVFPNGESVPDTVRGKARLTLIRLGYSFDGREWQKVDA